MRHAMKPKARLFVPDALAAGAAITLDADQSHYLRNVMRCQTGERVALFNGQHGEYSGEISEITKKSVTIVCGDQTRAQGRSLDITLAFAPLKKAAMDILVEKTTELGIARLQPVITARINAERVKLDRLAMQAREAAEQCERLDLPEIMPPMALKVFLREQEQPFLFCDETAAGERQTVTDQMRIRALCPPFTILIGPEGGFSSEERDILLAHPQAVPVGLGCTVLRAETAAIAALTLALSV